MRDDMPACKANSRFVIFDLYFPIIILNDFLSYKYTKKNGEMQELGSWFVTLFVWSGLKK